MLNCAEEINISGTREFSGPNVKNAVRQNYRHMSKHYYRAKVKQTSGGRIVYGFWSGIADFSCLGARYSDLAGYPYEDISSELMSDWQSVGNDMRTALKVVSRK